MLTVQFPILDAVCLRLKGAFDEARMAADQAEKRRAQGRTTAIAQEAEPMYGAELLPALLGGSWIRPSGRAHDANVLLSSKDRYRWHLRTLFDHPVVYRKAGTRGALNAASAAVIGRPYDALDKQGGVTAEALEIAGHLDRLGIGVWVRPDLSAWYPGWTQLVVAAVGLHGRTDAEAFGFRAIGPVMLTA